ncbi:MAG: response regulator [Geobacteraceae bacterium]|nr:response regulator [Geobacteraceae bacterium]
MDPLAGRMKLGEILIHQGILTSHLVDRIIEISHATHRRFGQTLEDMGLLTGEELASALALQFGYKIVSNLSTMDIPYGTVNMIPVEEAVNNRIFPIQVKDGRLALAMADPTNYEIISELSTKLNLKIIPFITTTKEIMKIVARKHLGISLEEMNNTVLVVNTDNRERIKLVETLNNDGFNTMYGVDPEEGFKQALLYQPKVIITAKDMPFSDGFAFFTTLQSVAETRRIPVILLSNSGSMEEEATAFKRGFFDYIQMPVKDITLTARTGRAIAAGRAYTPHRKEQSNSLM